jgi:hypothetical protein
MRVWVCYLLSLIFFFIAMLHIYWGVGGKKLLSAAIPTNIKNEALMRPGILSFIIVISGLLFLAYIFLTKTGISPSPKWLNSFNSLEVIAVAFIFFIRAIGEFNYVGFFKKVTNTPFAINDTYYYSPLCLGISLMAFYVFLKR